MSKVYVKLDKAAVGSFLKNDVVPMLQDKGNEIANNMGGAEVEVHVGQHRAFVNVRTSLKKTQNNELLKAMK